MAQIKVYGVAARLNPIKRELSEVIHSCVVESLGLPADKRFHRFFPLDPADFYYPPDRSDRYLILEISMFEGRSVETRKRLIRLLFQRITERFSITVEDLEITLFETPRHNWGIRGQPGDELNMTYRVEA